MPVGDEARDVIRHALRWVWKDEEMHTIYVRGALVKLGGLRVRVPSAIQQLTGWIGGWASSVQHHVRWRDAPLSRLFAALFTAMGALLGKVPRPVARALRFGSFGSFCRFNVDAERTAALCWKRLCDLAAEHENPHTPLAELQRICGDEERHERLFALFAAALDEHDRCLRAAGCGDVAVVESPNIYDQFYRHRSVPEVARYFDIPAPEFRLVDLGDEQVPHAYGRGMAQYAVGRTWRDADFRISFAKLRSHPVEHVHLSITNTEGLGMRCDHFLFAERQAQRESAVMTLLGDFPPHFALIEGYDLAPDGILGAMGSPRPRAPRRLYAGADALAVDVVAARHLGLRDPRQSSMLRAAFHWFGDPGASIELSGPDGPVAGWRGPHHNELSSMLSFVAYPIYVFGSGRGALFVPEMDEDAFPPVTPPSLALRVGRKLLQASLGLRFPR